MTIWTNVLAITGVFGGVEGCSAAPPKCKEAFKNWLRRLADTPKRLAGKASEALLVIVGSVVGAILSFLGKTVEFVSEHTWA